MEGGCTAVGKMRSSSPKGEMVRQGYTAKKNYLANTMILNHSVNYHCLSIGIGENTTNGRYKQSNSFCGEFLLTVKCIKPIRGTGRNTILKV